jgi:hypothetical protein
MRSEYAASFGAVNTREINKVLALFNGENQAIFKPLPSGLINFQTNYNKYIESPDCKNILKPNNKKYLKCSFLTKLGKNLSDSPSFKLQLTENNFENNIYNPNPATLASSNCASKDNQIVCDEIEITTLDFNKNINMWFNFDEKLADYTFENAMSFTFVFTKEENIKGNLKLSYFDTIDLNKSEPRPTGEVITIRFNDKVDSPNIKILTNNSTPDEPTIQNQTPQLSPKSSQDSDLTQNTTIIKAANKEEIKTKDLYTLTRTGGYDFGLIFCVLIFMSLIRFQFKSKINTKLV